MTAGKVTLDRDVVERLLAEHEHGEDCMEGIWPDGIRECECWQRPLRDALRGADDEAPSVLSARGTWMLPADDYDDVVDPMPEPASGSVVVTIDGRDVRFTRAQSRLRDEFDPVHWQTTKPLRANGWYWHTWADILRYAAENDTTPRVIE